MSEEVIKKGEMYRAGLPSPGARLLMAIGLIRKGHVVADIGCDHGKLAVYLVLAGYTEHVIAIDKRPLPLEKAKALVKQTSCVGKVDCRLGDGLEPLQENEATEIVIAGMSGETMAEILSARSWIQNTNMNFVFVPATRAEKLRVWLYANGFAICKECAVEENGRVYSVLQACYTGNPKKIEPFFAEVGLLTEDKSPAAKEYIEHRLHYLQKQQLAPLPDEQRQILDSLIQEMEKCLQ